MGRRIKAVLSIYALLSASHSPKGSPQNASLTPNPVLKQKVENNTVIEM